MRKSYFWFIFSGISLWIVRNAIGTACIPCKPDSPLGRNAEFEYSMPDGTLCKAMWGDYVDDKYYTLIGLRESFNVLPRFLYLSAGKAYELLYWDVHSRFCGSCGGVLERHSSISKICKSCHREYWPSLSTAIIVLVRRGDEVLLVQAKNFCGEYWGLIAGFVETGETLEECVRREVMEETGISITRICYYASQPWPYPCGLMVGFYADFVEGEIHLQASELNKGAWFKKNNLPTIPDKLSMARMLLDAWQEGRF